MVLTTRISKTSDDIICELRAITSKNKIKIIEEALVFYRHYELMRLLDESFEQLQANDQLWQKELEERRELKT